MIDPDISAADARALLSLPGSAGLGREGLNRRKFLQMVGLGMGAAVLWENVAGGASTEPAESAGASSRARHRETNGG